MIFHTIMFIASCALLFWVGRGILEALGGVARFLKLHEFVVAFFIMAFAATLPNLFIGIISAINDVPDLAFGDIVGGNLVDLTITIALAALFSKRGLPADGKIVQTSSIFTIAIASLPVLLIWDDVLGRGDGLILVMSFFFYIFWLFSEKERFNKVYDDDENPADRKMLFFFKNIGKVFLGIILLLIASEGIIQSAVFFSVELSINLMIVGILITGTMNCLPEIFFSIHSARRGEVSMLLGNLLGSIIIPASLALGVVAIICPVQIVDSAPLIVAKVFLLIAALSFIFAVRTENKVTKKEGFILLSIYLLFILVELFLR